MARPRRQSIDGPAPSRDQTGDGPNDLSAAWRSGPALCGVANPAALSGDQPAARIFIRPMSSSKHAIVRLDGAQSVGTYAVWRVQAVTELPSFDLVGEDEVGLKVTCAHSDTRALASRTLLPAIFVLVRVLGWLTEHHHLAETSATATGFSVDH